MKRSIVPITLATAMAAILAGGAAFSAPPEGKGPPTGDEEGAAQNLSVPTIMVGDAAGGLTNCGDTPSDLIRPEGEPLTGFSVDPLGYYWVQKVHTWQAQCLSDTEATVFGAWGDNLGGDAKLKVGSPIRVELVLHNLTSYPDLTPLQGYTVIKLQDTLDRLSAYGHLAGGNADDGWTDIPTAFLDVDDDPITGDPTKGWLVHDAGITFSVQNLDTGIYAVEPGTSPTAEINATGKVVYGYNLRVDSTGTYRIRFTTSAAVMFSEVDVGVLEDANNVYIDIDVGQGGGGGGGGQGKGKPQR
jgi:hypothetical protein